MASRSPHFFSREGDGSVRLRIKLGSDDATLIENAAGDTPLLDWIHQTLRDAARRQIDDARALRPAVGPPEKAVNTEEDR